MALEFLLDADAVINLHSLKLIECLADAIRGGAVQAHCTRYVWEQELSSLNGVRRQLEEAGLRAHRFKPSDPAGVTFRKMLKGRGGLGRNSKGEVEVVAFARHCAEAMVVVARDEGTHRTAKQHGIPAIDLGSFVCELVERGALAEEEARQALAPWDNPGAGNGRPKGYPGFTQMLANWRIERSRLGQMP